MSFAVYLTRNKSVASELVNDVFLAIWHKRDEFTFDDEKDDNNDRSLSLSLSAPDANFPGAP